jgi:hypothetical protein
MIRPLQVRFGRGDAQRKRIPKNLCNIDSDRADSFRVGGASPPRNAITSRSGVNVGPALYKKGGPQSPFSTTDVMVFSCSTWRV